MFPLDAHPSLSTSPPPEPAILLGTSSSGQVRLKSFVSCTRHQAVASSTSTLLSRPVPIQARGWPRDLCWQNVASWASALGQSYNGINSTVTCRHGHHYPRYSSASRPFIAYSQVLYRASLRLTRYTGFSPGLSVGGGIDLGNGTVVGLDASCACICPRRCLCIRCASSCRL